MVKEMSPDMTNHEAIEMMNRCKREIIELRGAVDRLKPKADAYDNLVTVLRLLPQQSIPMGEDMVWVLDKRIRELTSRVETNKDS